MFPYAESGRGILRISGISPHGFGTRFFEKNRFREARGPPRPPGCDARIRIYVVTMSIYTLISLPASRPADRPHRAPFRSVVGAGMAACAGPATDRSLASVVGR